jgi:hypothetical protein
MINTHYVDDGSADNDDEDDVLADEGSHSIVCMFRHIIHIHYVGDGSESDDKHIDRKHDESHGPDQDSTSGQLIYRTYGLHDTNLTGGPDDHHLRQDDDTDGNRSTSIYVQTFYTLRDRSLE